MAELDSQRGCQFNPEVIDAFFPLLREPEHTTDEMAQASWLSLGSRPTADWADELLRLAATSARPAR